MNIKESIPFEISANGVYRSIRYLLGIDIYPDDNGWINESKKLSKKYTYKAIKHCLEDELIPIGKHYYNTYEGDYLWEHLFLTDKNLSVRIHHMGFTSLAQLQHYANVAASRK